MFAGSPSGSEILQESFGNSASSDDQLAIKVVTNFIRQSPQYTLAVLQPGVYLIGMKDQFNTYDLVSHPLHHQIQFIADENGFILLDRKQQQDGKPSIECFGAYHVEQYIIMEVLSKQEVSQNVLNYYVHNKEKLKLGVDNYSEVQGKGFICWRFLRFHH